MTIEPQSVGPGGQQLQLTLQRMNRTLPSPQACLCPHREETRAGDTPTFRNVAEMGAFPINPGCAPSSSRWASLLLWTGV